MNRDIEIAGELTDAELLEAVQEVNFAEESDSDNEGKPQLQSNGGLLQASCSRDEHAHSITIIPSDREHGSYRSITSQDTKNSGLSLSLIVSVSTILYLNIWHVYIQ